MEVPPYPVKRKKKKKTKKTSAINRLFVLNWALLAKSLTFTSSKVKLCFVHTILTKLWQIVHAYLFRSLQKSIFQRILISK